ncbi:hypothetical protein [Agathobaculum sp.]|uniref:hypothetical protein n=1 Tax=Agathobaculum sp. TaxID=2048138 RepID=UPI0039A0E29F
MTEKMIKALESKGFHRWTKGDYDRLYANAEDFGLYTESYNSGNIRYAELNGVKISNAAAGRILSAKIYIDVKTGELITSRITADADEIVEAVKAAIAEAKAEVESEEAEKASAPQLSEDAVREALIKYQSAESEEDGVDYYLHVTSDGKIVPNMYEANETFISSAHCSAYGYTVEQWQSGEVSTEDVYDHEVAGDPVFDEIVRELTDQANAWLAKEAD